MRKITIEWAQSPSRDVKSYYLYISKTVPSYTSSYCVIPKPPGNRPRIKYELADCNLIKDFSGLINLSVAAVDFVGNISDLTPPVAVDLGNTSILRRLVGAVKRFLGLF